MINRIDEIEPEQLAELRGLLNEQFPGTPVLALSAKEGTGFEGLLELLEQDGLFGRKILEIDYDTYAEGEAELGWLNTSIHLTSEKPFELDALLLEVVKQLHVSLIQKGAEVAHLKVIGLDEGIFGVANLVSSTTQPELSLASGSTVREADVVVNARVAIDPALLESEVNRIVLELAKKQGITASFRQSQSLRPGRPTPTHRYPKEAEVGK